MKVLDTRNEGAFVAPSRQTFGEYLADWLPAIESTVKPSTFHSYERNVRNHVIPYIGGIPLQRLTSTDLEMLYSRLLKQGRRDYRDGAGLSPRTVAYVATIIHRALRKAVRQGSVTRNVADTAEAPKGSATAAPAMKTWTAPQLSRFLDSVRSDPLYPVFFLTATTGMRRGEVLALIWADIDLEERRLSIRRTLGVIAGELQFGEPKTTKATRSIALDPSTVTMLRAHRARQAQERLMVGAGYNDEGLVFAQPDGNALDPDNVSAHFIRRAHRCDLPRIRFHDLRHTWASLALQAGVHPKVVSERLGHANISITLDTYSHVIPAMQEDAAERVSSLLFGGEH